MCNKKQLRRHSFQSVAQLKASVFFSKSLMILTDVETECLYDETKGAANITTVQQLMASSTSSANSVLFPTSVIQSTGMCPISSCPPLIKCIQREEEKGFKSIPPVDMGASTNPLVPSHLHFQHKYFLRV